MTKKVKSTILHVAEALAVLCLAFGVSHFFPEQAVAAGGVAFVALSGLVKGARVSNAIPVPDYVNGKE